MPDEKNLDPCSNYRGQVHYYLVAIANLEAQHPDPSKAPTKVQPGDSTSEDTTLDDRKKQLENALQEAQDELATCEQNQLSPDATEQLPQETQYIYFPGPCATYQYQLFALQQKEERLQAQITRDEDTDVPVPPALEAQLAQVDKQIQKVQAELDTCLQNNPEPESVEELPLS